jgi:hypothetical protein
MALTKKPATEQASPAFESMDDTVVETVVTDEPSAPAAAPQAQASLPAVVPANPSARQFAPSWPSPRRFPQRDRPNVCGIQHVHPCHRGAGRLRNRCQGRPGQTIKLQLMSFNDRYTLSPGVQDADATEHVRFSVDGKTIDGTGEDCAAYIEKLKTRLRDTRTQR